MTGIMLRLRLFALLGLIALVLACGDDDAATDAGARSDAGGADAGTASDAGSAEDAGDVRDAGSTEDAGSAEDAGPGEDAGSADDAGSGGDAGPGEDAGVDAGSEGCGDVGSTCSEASPCPGDDLACEAGVCVRSAALCGGFVGADCPASAPVCPRHPSASGWPCVTEADRECICANDPGREAFPAACVGL